MAVGGHGYDHGFGPYQTTLTPRSRSQLQWDDSKAGSSGWSLRLPPVCFYHFFQVAALYDNARSAIQDAVTPFWSALPSVSESCTFLLGRHGSENFFQEWAIHIEAKYLHFSAAAQYRKSIDDTERSKSALRVYASVFAIDA